MLSLLTNGAASSALRNLNLIQSNLTTTEQQASTGLKVSTAADNAAYWAIASRMSSTGSALAAVSSAISQSIAIANVTLAALTNIISTVTDMRNLLIAAKEPGSDLTEIQTQIAADQQQIITRANAASFNGQNWLVDNWQVSGDSSYTSTVDPPDKTSQDEISANYDGTITTVTSSQSEGLFTDDWGNSVYTSYSKTSTFVQSYSNSPNDKGGTDYFYNHDLTVESSDINGQVPESFANVPIGYNDTDLTVFYAISKSDLKLFDNYIKSTPSSNGGTPTKSEYSSYQSPAGVPYVSTLPELGLGVFSTSTPGTPVVQKAHSDATPPTTNDRYFDNNVEKVPVAGTGSSIIYTETLNLLTLDVTSMSQSDIQSALGLAEDTSVKLDKMASTLGVQTKTLKGQQDYLTSVTTSYAEGIGSLVDADMNQVSTRLSALQVQQQLGIQSLSIANANAATVLKLFGA